ncbi:MAG: Gfo/Idh/MocA family oxidoreductase [Pirellulaceae bacterium]|jgi:predicted dehydrogenase|nr:Gfo/Idh/MocA family oxidoreductase [Pirellulaceae bacterium]MDP7016390.1 Gfo/Idh/MocA family oxidoreductase [Pirellulaceae bacterium]
MDKLKLGMIGAGYIGQLGHLANFAQLSGCEVTALADLRPALREQVAGRHGIEHTYASHRELLENSDVDAVVVVTPRSQTYSVALDCLLAGKHVLTEKPMAVSVDEGEALVAAAAEQRVRYCVGYMKRYDAGVDEARRMLADPALIDALGPIRFARGHCYMGDSYCNAGGQIETGERAGYPDNYARVAPDWVPLQHRENYGSFINTYSHVTNLLRYLFGSQPTVEYTHLGSRESQLCVLRFGSFLASLETGRSSSRDWEEEVVLFFDHGKLTLKMPPALLRNTPARVELYTAGQEQQIVRPLCDWSWSFQNQARAFVSDVRENRPSRIDGADALEDLRLAEELWRRDLAK